MIITVATMKGGTGKTTLAVNLACLLSETTKKKVVILDLDRQELAAAWSQVAGNLPCSVVKSGNPLDLLKSGKDVVVIDTPGNLHAQETQQAIRAADLVLIPCTPSPAEMEASRRTVGVVRELSQKPCLVVINRLRPGTITGRAVEDWAAQLGAKVAETKIQLREAYQQTALSGWVNKGEGKEELQSLLIEILDLVANFSKTNTL
ncbi:MAG: ParA family protein [Verrucomicrobiae bacterium]|nr:ParA family protein [Verrucomicrobiae bacterium]